MLTTIERVILLRRVDVFTGVPTEKLAELAAVSEEVDRLEGDVLFRESEPSDALYLVIHGDVSLLRYARDFLLPALTGNVIGGVTLVALLNHAQVTAGGDDEEYEPHRT